MVKKILLLNCLFIAVVITDSKKAQAQHKENKEVKTSIIITDGDTTVNGKKFKTISEKERAELRKEFKVMEEGAFKIPRAFCETKVMILKDSVLSTDDNRVKSFTIRRGGKPMDFEFKRDSVLQESEGLNTDREIRIRRNVGEDVDWEMLPLRRAAPGKPRVTKMNNFKLERPNLPNSNTFNYSTTDKDGFTTRVAFTIVEPSNKDLKHTFNNEKLAFNGLNITDIMLMPNFSSGKTTLTFIAKTKGDLAIKIIDSTGNNVFVAQKTGSSENYNTNFSAAKNGIYFLQITQGTKTFVRKIVKN